MPNHVYSSMTIVGEVAIIKTFAKKHFTGGQLDLSSFAPMPKELEGTVSPSTAPHNSTESEVAEWERKRDDLIKKYGFDNWYDWCIENWGTKWNTYDGDVDEMGDTIVCNFQTAWNLPEPIFVLMGKMYPGLEFNLECVEEGGFFSGTLSIVNGVVDDSGITNDSAQWKNYARDFMGWDLDEDDEEADDTATDDDREMVQSTLNDLRSGEIKNRAVVNEIVLFMDSHLDEFMKFVKPF